MKKEPKEEKLNWINWKWTNGEGAYLKLMEGKIHHTEDWADGNVLVDRDKKGNIIGIEILT